MPVSAPPQHLSANVRVQCRALASSARDPWEDEAEFLAEWLAQPGPGRVVNIHPVPRDSHAWGTPIEGSLAARAQSHAGHPLDPGIRRDFESRLHRDLGDVRIHDDKAARDLAHSLGAEAFTLGNDIFTTRPDRALIAHEVVHAVQQGKAGEIPETSPRIQASFERTSAELDPKVGILLDIHLRKKGKQLKAIADDKLLAAKSWWRTFRTNVEKKDAATPIDFKAEVENAIKEIGGYKSLDTAVGDPIQNGVAALLADYLRLNDAPELAAKVVVEYPWSMTALPSQEVANAIADQKNRGKAAKVALPRIWKTYKPKGAVVADSWTKEIADAADKFLSLTPLDEHQKQREALRDRLNEPLIGSSRIPDPAKALPPFDRLTDKSVPLGNELDEYASSGITWLRGIWASILNTRLTAKTTETSTTSIALWDADVGTLKNAADKIGTPADPAIIFNKLDWMIPVIEEAHLILAEDLAPAIQKHYDFWANVSQTVVNESPSESDKYLQLAYGDQTYAQLFFAADQGALATQLQDIVSPLADAVEAYFDLFGTGKLPSREQRDTVQEVFARHRECADAFREVLRATVQPSITKKLHLARVAGKAELAKGLGWFALKMERIHTTLEKVPVLDKESKTEILIESIELRGAVAMELWEIARDALGKTGADIYNSQLPADQRKNIEGKANVPASGEWQAIMDRAEKAYTLGDIQTGLLLLRNPFQPSEKSETSQLIKDAGGDVIRGLEPFTGRDLAKLSDVMYHRSLAEELTALSDEALANERSGEPRVKEDLWLVQKAYDSLKAREGSEAMPQRYESRSVYWVPYAGDDKRAFGRLLDQQKAYGEFITEKETRLNIVLSANNQPDDDGDAWAWTLPIPSELVAPLYQIALLRGLAKLPVEDLNAALAARSAPDAKNAAKKNSELLGDLAQKARKLGKNIPADARPQEGFFNWYQALNDRVRQIKEALGGDFLDTEATKQVRLETIKTLAEQQTLTKRDSDAAKRRATTLDRRVIARMNGELLQSAIDEHIRHQAAIGVALDNHDAFRGAVRPDRTANEIKLQSAALILDDADRWIEIIDDRPIGSYQRQIHLLVSEALETFPRLLDKPPGPATGNQPVDPAQHAEGIAWETDTQREEVAKKIERVTPEFTKALESMRAELLPYQWDLGITARKTQGDSAHAELFSHLAPSFPVKTIASIQAANAAEKDEEKRVPELIPIGGPLGLKIVNVHQDFTFLAGIGDRASASSEERGKYALYLPARLYLGVAASKPTDLANIEATLVENPKQSSRDVQEKGEPLVDVEIMEGTETFSKFTIYSGEVAGARGGLNWLAGVVHNTAAHDKFAAMAATVEGFGQLLILAASLYPPTALAVTAAELSAFTLQLLADPEFKEALESISKDPIESVKHAAGELKAQFTVGRLFDLLLNGNFEPDRFIGSATLRGKKRSNKLSRGRMAKVLTRLKRVGAVFAVRLEGFQESVQGPVHRIESSMGNHPRLATMVEWLGGHLKDLSDPEGMILKHPVAGPIYEAYARYRLRGSDEDAGSAIGQPLGDIAEHLQTGLDRMAHFELPATLIPLDLAIEALVDIALKLAPKTGKIGIARTLAQMLQEGLRATGANSVVYGFLAEQISNSWVDPNHYWKNDVVPLLEPPVKGAIQSAADSIGGHLSKAPLIGDYFGNDRMKGARPIPSTDRATLPNGKAAESAKIGVSDALDDVFESEQVTALVPDEAGMTETRELKFSDVSGMPDAFFEGIQKKPAAGPAPGAAGAGGTNSPAGSPSPMPPGASLQGAPSPTGHSSSAFASAGGAPLAPAQRREAEQKFGHDFSHVRLHQGPDAWAATGRRGADGLTSGSHVFLRPDLNPRSGRGQKVMEHELAHVLQKTSGPSTTSKPTQGGIRWKPSEESAANRMADRAQHNTTRRAISVEGAHRDGASPAIGLDLMETFFKKLSSPSAGSSLAETIDRAHARKKVADVHPDSVSAANGLWDSIRANMRGTLEVASHFKASTAKIKEHLENRLSTITRDGGSVPAAGKVIDHLAAMSEKDPEPPAGGKPAASGSAPAKAKPTFDARGFLADLSLYITGRSGIVFDFGLSEAEVKRLKSDPNAKVTVGTKVKHIELLFVSNLTEAGLKLWDTTIQNTTWTRTDDAKLRRDALRKVLETEFHAAAPSSTHTDATASAAPTATTEKAKEPAKGGDRGSYTPIWNTTKTDLALNATYMEKVETQLQPAELSSDMMPSWGFYAVPATEPFKTIATSGKSQVEKNAVHWKTKIHKELTGGTFFLPENKRNSHHIVQYLLPEYFSNIKEFQPFPKLAQGKAYPGVKGTTTAVDSISGDGQSIGVSQTEAGRGNAMPAILLSASAHQNSGLHVTPKPDDTGKASQGYTIHREFRKFLATGVTAHLGATREGDALDDYLVALGAGNANGQKAIVEAVRKTYAWIKDQNEQNLVAPEGMPGHEADFYVSQFRASADAKKNFQSLTGQDYDTGSADIRTRIQTRIQAEAKVAMTDAIATLAQAPLGWKLPGA